MSNSWWRTSAGLNAAGNVAKGLATLLGAGVVAALLGNSTLATVLIALGAASAAAAVILAYAEGRAKAGEERARLENEQAALVRAAAERLLVPVRPVREVSPYDVGVDTESPEARTAARRQDQLPYVARERDETLRRALAKAATRQGPSLIVLEGDSKAGKSRTLFEAARRRCLTRSLSPRSGMRSRCSDCSSPMEGLSFRPMGRLSCGSMT